MLSLATKQAIYYLPVRLMLRFGRRFEVDGIRVVIPLKDREKAEHIRDKIAASLALIKKRSPKYYARVHRFSSKILVFALGPELAACHSKLRFCNLSSTYVQAEETSPAGLAMTLIHEATHGYLDSLDIGYEETIRRRVECICVMTEIRFASQLPDAEELLEDAFGRLNISDEFFTNEAFIERDMEMLKSMDAPRWLKACLENLQTKRRRKLSR